MRCVQLSCLIVAVAMPTLALPSKIDLKVTTFTLANGMVVLLHEDHTTPNVYVATDFRVGSSNELPGRTGFAHLFEHLMFEGSAHVPHGQFDALLEEAGGRNNAFTSADQTYYYEAVPSHAAELPLFLDSDRMAFFAPTMQGDLVEHQRDVVKNELRQRVEQTPYAPAREGLNAHVFPPGHPYSWPVIGSMADLSAASLQDVRDFHQRWYAPGNAVMAVVGDFDTADMKRKVEHWYGDVPRRAAPPRASPLPLTSLSVEKRVVVQDNNAPQPTLIIAWPTVFEGHEDDANLQLATMVLSAHVGSRLDQRLVNQLGIAQSVTANQDSMLRAGVLTIEVTAVPGVPLAKILAAVDVELDALKQRGPTPTELSAARAKIETDFVDSLDGLHGKGQMMIGYQRRYGDPNSFDRDLRRYRDATAESITAAVRRYVTAGRVVMSVVPPSASVLAITPGAQP